MGLIDFADKYLRTLTPFLSRAYDQNLIRIMNERNYSVIQLFKKGINQMYVPNINVAKLEEIYGNGDKLIKREVISLSRGDHFGEKGIIRSVAVSKNKASVIFNGGKTSDIPLDSLHLIPITKEELELEQQEYETKLQEIKEKRAYLEQSKSEKLDLDKFRANNIAKKVSAGGSLEDEIYRIIKSDPITV